jgi:hypothetical protein
MSRLWERYLKELWKRWHLLAVWEPTSTIALGDVGVMEDRIWRKLGSLGQHGIGFATHRAGSRSDRNYSSAGEVQLGFDGGAGVAGVPVKGKVRVSFSSQGAVLFNASGCEEVRIADVGSLEEEIWRRFKNGGWDPRHIVVTKVIEVERAAILIAGSKRGEATFSVKAVAGLDLDTINLASASLAPSLTHSKDLLGSYVAESLTPIFEAICIDRDGLLRRRIGAATPAGGRLAPSDGAEEEDTEGSLIPYCYEYEEFLGDED